MSTFVDSQANCMADLVITASLVKPGTAANPIRGLASNAITAGEVVCVLADGSITQADANAGSPLNAPVGIACCSAAGPGQYVMYVNLDNDFTIGATVISGEPYFLSANPGKICDQAGLTAGMLSTFIGIGKGTTKLTISLFPSGQTV